MYYKQLLVESRGIILGATNLQIREFSQNIINYINSVDIPMEVKRLVIKDIYTQIEIEASKVINREREVADNGNNEEVQPS